MKSKAIITLVSFMLCLTSSFTLANKEMTKDELEQAIDYATQKGNIKEVKQLLSKGADANTNYIGYPILWRAVDGNYTDIVKLLINKGADVNTPSQSGKMPLMIAAMNRNTDIAKMLLKAGADINAKETFTMKRTALLYALDEVSFKHAGAEKRKDHEIVSLLLDHGADVNAENAERYTVLMRTLMKADFDMIKQIVNKGADVNRVTTQGNALGFTVGGKDEKKIKYILERTKNVDAPNYEGETPFMIASMIGATESIKLLVGAGANIHAMNNKGETALHLAAKTDLIRVKHNWIPAIKLLIELGVDPNIRAENDTHFTALIRAAQKGYADRAKALLEGGAKVDLHSGLGDTALMWASQNGHVQTVKVLLAHGADPNRPGFGGITPLDHAKEHKEIRELLINAGASQSGMDKLKTFLKNLFN